MERRHNSVQNGQRSRRIKRTVDKEQYYTSKELVEKCIALVESKIGFDNYNLVVEPSAGEGAFFSKIPNHIKKVGVDIDPKLEGITKANFFDWLPENTNGKILVLGNPPFGQRANLAVKFIEHASTFADAIAFILPRSFNKYTFLNRVPGNLELVDSFDCDDFNLATGENVKVKCVFQIWKRASRYRAKIQPRNNHPDFEMCHCHLSRTTDEKLAEVRLNFPFSIPQVGSNFKIRSSLEPKSGSHWFLKPTNSEVLMILEKLDFSFLAGMNTAFTSLSKKDIIRAYEEAQSKNHPLSKNNSIGGTKDSQLELGL